MPLFHIAQSSKRKAPLCGLLWKQEKAGRRANGQASDVEGAYRLKIAHVAGLLGVLTLTGCGGGSGSNPAATSRKITITTNWVAPNTNPGFGWPEANHAVLTLKGAATDGGDFVFPYDRNGVADELSSSAAAKVGTWTMEARFYFVASTGAQELQYIARAVVKITPSVPYDISGRIASDLTIDMGGFEVGSIDVAPGQTIKAGTSAPLIFTAHPQGTPSQILALMPGQEVVTISSGADHLSYANSAMSGLTPGTATLTVGSSAPATVTVLP